MTRMIVSTAVLAVSAWIGFKAWQMAPALSLDWTGKSTGWVTTGLPIAAFVLSFLIIRKIGKVVASPFGKSSDEQKPRSLAGTILRLIFALVPTSLISLIGAAFLHHTGSVAEVRAFSEKSNGQAETAPDGFSRRLKSAVEGILPAAWIKTIDPLADPSRLTLAKLITTQADPDLAPVINPKTGKPIPRAIIVDDPDLQNLARDGKFGTLLRHPLLTKALADPKIQQLIRGLNL